MEQKKKKMEEFVLKIWSNPALANASVVKKENQVLSFIKENGPQLQVAFARPEFFPDVSWKEAMGILLTVLTEMTLRDLEPRVSQAIVSSNLPGLMEHFRGSGNLEPGKLSGFITGHLRQKALRDHYGQSLTAISAGFFERYVPAILARRKLIYNELVRRDRLNMEPHLLPGFISLAALFRPLFYWRYDRPGGQPVSMAEVAKNPKMFDSAFKDLNAALQREVGQVPEQVLKPAMESCFNLNHDPDLSGAAKLLSLLLNRVSDFDPTQKVDKGAETPDKSWFNINRRTAKFYGYDPQFLEELYQIAGEEGW